MLYSYSKKIDYISWKIPFIVYSPYNNCIWCVKMLTLERKKNTFSSDLCVLHFIVASVSVPLFSIFSFLHLMLSSRNRRNCFLQKREFMDGTWKSSWCLWARVFIAGTPKRSKGETEMGLGKWNRKITINYL